MTKIFCCLQLNFVEFHIFALVGHKINIKLEMCFLYDHPHILGCLRISETYHMSILTSHILEIQTISFLKVAKSHCASKNKNRRKKSKGVYFLQKMGKIKTWCSSVRHWLELHVFIFPIFCQKYATFDFFYGFLPAGTV